MYLVVTYTPEYPETLPELEIVPVHTGTSMSKPPMGHDSEELSDKEWDTLRGIAQSSVWILCQHHVML